LLPLPKEFRNQKLSFSIAGFAANLQPICHLPGRFGEDWSVVGGLGSWTYREQKKLKKINK